MREAFRLARSKTVNSSCTPAAPVGVVGVLHSNGDELHRQKGASAIWLSRKSLAGLTIRPRERTHFACWHATVGLE